MSGAYEEFIQYDIADKAETIVSSKEFESIKVGDRIEPTLGLDYGKSTSLEEVADESGTLISAESLLSLPTLESYGLEYGRADKSTMPLGETPNPKQFPYSTVYKLRVKLPGSRLGLGSAFACRNGILVTAAHCLYVPLDVDGGRKWFWPEAIDVLMPVDANNYRTVASVVHSYIPKKYRDGTVNLETDWGLATLSSVRNAHTIGLAIPDSKYIGKTAALTGFPGGGDITTDTGPITEFTIQGQPNTCAAKIPAEPGNSGGPLHTDEWKEHSNAYAIAIAGSITDPSDGKIYCRSMDKQILKFITWLDTSRVVTSATATSKDGRIEHFCLDIAGNLWHKWQAKVNGAWNDSWVLVGKDLQGPITVISNMDRRLELFILDKNNELQHRYQMTPNGGWSIWNNRGKGMKFQVGSITAILSEDERIEVFALDMDNNLQHICQLKDKSWSPWVKRGSDLALPLTATRNKDGRIEIFMQTKSSGRVCHFYQTAPNGDWSEWQLL